MPDSDETTFYVLKFLEPGDSRSANLSWSEIESFTGRIYLINQKNERIDAKQYEEGKIQGAITAISKDEFEAFTDGKQRMAITCFVETTHHYINWYRIYPDGSREYIETTYEGSTYERICLGSGGSRTGGGIGGSGSGGGYDGGSGNGGGESGDCDPVHGCFDREEVEDELIPPPPILTFDDNIEATTDTTNINCSSSDLSKYEQAWCVSSIPEGEQLETTNNVLNNIEQRGSNCAEIAEEGKKLLREFGLRYFPDPNDNFSFGGLGHPSWGIILAEGWIDNWASKTSIVEDVNGEELHVGLGYALVHEIEHAIGRDHITLSNGQESKWRTPNAKECSVQN